jgi:hypothetical protein
MKLRLLFISTAFVLAGCEVHHIHHFNKKDLVDCDCDQPAMIVPGGYPLPLSYDKNVKVLPPVYQPVPPYPHYPMVTPKPAPKVNMPEYFKLTPVEPGQVAPRAQPMQAMPQGGHPMSYSPYQAQPIQQQPVMPIQMSSNSSKSSDSNIKTYLFQPAGGVVYQY